AAVSSTASPSMSAMITRVPSSNSHLAIPLPIPWPPPVTSTIRSAFFAVISCLHCQYGFHRSRSTALSRILSGNKDLRLAERRGKPIKDAVPAGLGAAGIFREHPLVDQGELAACFRRNNADGYP